MPSSVRLQSIPAGAQVYDSYGQKCNHRFLLNYGFAVEDNRELDGFCPNEAPMELTLDPQDPLFSQKSELWMRGEVNLTKSTTKRVRVCIANNENHRLLLGLLRAMNANEEELQSLSSPVMSGDMRSIFDPHPSPVYRSVKDIRHTLSLRNERAAMYTLLHTVSSALEHYPTSLSTDKEDLLDEQRFPAFSNKRHAKIQIRGEKEVLHHYAIFARTALDMMDLIEQELKEEQQRGVEVQLGRGILSEETSRRCGFDFIARTMEEDEDTMHHTIVRYCVDTLGSLRKEEIRSLRRQRALLNNNLESPAVAARKRDARGHNNSYC
jgi:protein-histidine N-methyltransferase